MEASRLAIFAAHTPYAPLEFTLSRLAPPAGISLLDTARSLY